MPIKTLYTGLRFCPFCRYASDRATTATGTADVSALKSAVCLGCGGFLCYDEKTDLLPLRACPGGRPDAATMAKMFRISFELRRMLKAKGRELAPAGTCVRCGCQDYHACDGGCYWVEPDLCSQCAIASEFLDAGIVRNTTDSIEAFSGGLMCCIMCGERRAMHPTIGSGWHALDVATFRFYVCTHEMPVPELASVNDINEAFRRIVLRMVEIRRRENPNAVPIIQLHEHTPGTSTHSRS